MSTDTSFGELMSGLRRGDTRAAAVVFERFTRRLVALARAKLSHRVQQKMDAEDIIQSVYKSFFVGLAEGEFHFRGTGGLWTLLALITARKCQRYNGHFATSKRDAQKEICIPLATEDSAANWEVAGEEPRPDEVTLVGELVERLMNGLANERQRRMLELRLQGHTVREIAESLGSTEAIIRNVLRHVETHLERLLREPVP